MAHCVAFRVDHFKLPGFGLGDVAGKALIAAAISSSRASSSYIRDVVSISREENPSRRLSMDVDKFVPAALLLDRIVKSNEFEAQVYVQEGRDTGGEKDNTVLPLSSSSRSC